jgi:hypothetical protein
MIWDKTYGGSGDGGAESLIQTSDGSYVVAGVTYSEGASGGVLGNKIRCIWY